MVNLSDWPVYFKERLLIGNLESDLGIVTLWTPKEIVAKEISSNDYCLLGQLYTKRGINFILRNILARPQIRRLIITGSDLSGSGEALISLVNKGVEELEGRRRIRGVENGFIDEEISAEAIETFRQNVVVTRIPEINKLTNKPTWVILSRSEFWSEAETFPDPASVNLPTRPSEGSVFTVRHGKIADAWVEILKNVLSFGTESPTIYGGTKKELLNVTAVIDEEDSSKPFVPDYLGLSQSDVTKYINDVFKPERGEEPYTYGERLLSYDPLESKIDPFPINQIDSMVKKLKGYGSDPGALAILWQPEIDNFDIRKPWRTPCLTLIQGLVQNGALHLTAYFRSNDLFGAWPLNAFALRHLQTNLSKQLSVKTGLLTTISSCAHIYDNALPEAERVVAENDRLNCRFDPRGNFVVSVVGDMIKLSHLSPQGELLKEWEEGVSRGDSRVVSQILSTKVLQYLGISSVAHALDIGAQLARAEESIRQNKRFVQDNLLQ